MAKDFDELTKNWPGERLARVEARAKQLIAEEMTLRNLHKAPALRWREAKEPSADE